MPPARLSIVRNFSALLSTEVTGRIIRFAYLIVIARFLSPGEVGLFSYGVAFYLTLLGLAQFGQGTLLATRVGGRPHRLAQTAAHSLTLTFVATATVVTFAYIFLGVTENDPAVMRALSFFLLALIARAIASWVRGIFVALERTSWIPRYELAFRGLEGVAGTVLLALGAGLFTVCFLHFLAWGLEAATSLVLLIRRTDVTLKLGHNWRLLKGFAAVSTLYTVNLWLLNAFAQVGIVGLRLIQPDAAQVAYFGIAIQFLTTLLVAPISLSQAVLPGLSRARKKRSVEDMRAVALLVKASLTVGALAAGAIMEVGPWIITLFFGEQYRTAGEAFAWLSWGLGPYAAAFIAAQSLNALGERGRAAFSALLMVTAQVLLMVALLPLGGIEATTLALVVAAVAGTGASAASLGPRVGIAGHGWWLRPLGIAALAAVPALSGTLQPVWASTASLATVLILTWGLGVFSRREIQHLSQRLGVNSRRISHILFRR